MSDQTYTPETLRALFARSVKEKFTLGMLEIALELYADAWQEQVERMQLDFEKAVDRALDTTPAGRAYLAKHQAELEAAKAREEAHIETIRLQAQQLAASEPPGEEGT